MKSFLFLPLLVLTIGSFAAGAVTCSDSKGQVVYKYFTSNYGIPPRPGEDRWRSTEEWDFQGKELFKTETFESGSIKTSGVSVSAQFDTASKKLIAGDSDIPVTDPLPVGKKRTYVIRLTFAAHFEPPFSTQTFMICDEVMPPPAP